MKTGFLSKNHNLPERSEGRGLPRAQWTHFEIFVA
jgi:hypothetical protein